VSPDTANPPLINNDYIINNERTNNISAPAKADAKKSNSSSSLVKRREQVKVSDSDHTKLIAKHGEESTEKAYDFLNDWKASKAETDPKALTKHTDYYRITKWVMKEVKEQPKTGYAKSHLGKLALPGDGKIDGPDAAWRKRKL
ncbi:hypothetical protein U6S14_12310, partial [Cutibacterium acnes]